jgi:hypothetical protein
VYTAQHTTTSPELRLYEKEKKKKIKNENEKEHPFTASFHSDSAAGIRISYLHMPKAFI